MSTVPPNQVEELKSAFGNVSMASESGLSYLLIEGLKLPAGCAPYVVDALFCPVTNDGYKSRLYLSQQVSHTGKGQNWHLKNVHILGRSWFALSWKINAGNDRLLTKLLAHLEAFRS